MAAIRLVRNLAASLAIIFLAAQLLLGGHAHAWGADENAPADHCVICTVKTAQYGGVAPPPVALVTLPGEWQIAIGYVVREPLLPRSLQLSAQRARGPPLAL